MPTRILMTLLGVAMISSPCRAKVFRNAYVQFDLPEQWNCSPEGTEWVCSSQNKIDSKESIIILTAKEAGPQDTFKEYETYLRTPKRVSLLNGKTVLSQVKSVRTRKINGQDWVDALHLGSEIPGYYTRYLATVKTRLAILVTLSAHQKYYTKYSNDYFRAVESLRVTAPNEALSPEAKPIAPLPGTAPEAVGKKAGGIVAPADTEPPPPEEGESGTSSSLLLGLGIVLLAAAGYYVLKKK